MRKLVLLAAICLFSLQASAQILIGPTAGGQLNWISFYDKKNKEEYAVSPLYSYHAGATLSFRVQKRFFLQSSLLYTVRGKELEGKIDRLFRHTARYNYIDLPVLYTAEFKSKIGRYREFKWYFGAGPVISYWLGGKGKFYNSEVNENFPQLDTAELQNYTIKFGAPDSLAAANSPFSHLYISNANRLQLGLNFSTGVVFEPVGFHKIMLTVRYEIGHSFLSRKSKGNFAMSEILFEDDLRTRNNALVVSLHYLIDLKTDQRLRGKSTNDEANRSTKRVRRLKRR